LERLAERNAGRVAERNRQVADAAEVALRTSRGGLRHFRLLSWLLARDVYHDACPPDPLRVVLLLADDRFTIDAFGEISLASKWDRAAVPPLPLSIVELMEAALGDAAVELGLNEDPFHSIRPWLDAVGYPSAPEAEAGEEVTEEDLRAWAAQIYRFRVGSRRRKGNGKVVEARGDQTLGELDLAIRLACGHDTWDHLSEFYVPTGGRRRQEGLGEIYPGGEEGEGAQIVLGTLRLEPGDTLQYVYDFGDWIEHTLTVEAVLPPEPGAEYPREVEAPPSRRQR
jgi:hypothetical protein